LCTECGKEAFNGTVLCKECAEKKRVRDIEYQKRRTEEGKHRLSYKELKDNGICVYCKKQKASENKVMCDDCRRKQSDKKKSDRIFYKELGICPRCKKNTIYGDEGNCLECRSEMYSINLKYKDTEKSREQGRRIYYKRKQQGLCATCGKRSNIVGSVSCERCLKKKRYYNEKYNADIPRSHRVSYGLCYICGNPLDTDKKLCSVCCEVNTRNLKDTSRGKNKYWIRDNMIAFS
jgi:hypothetical protein